MELEGLDGVVWTERTAACGDGHGGDEIFGAENERVEGESGGWVGREQERGGWRKAVRTGSEGVGILDVGDR